MAGNTKDLYLGAVGVGTTSPYQSVQAVALVDEQGKHISNFSISAGIVTVNNIVQEVEVKNDSGNPIPTVGVATAVNFQVGIATTFSRPGTAVTFSANFVMGPSASNGNLNVLTFTECGRFNGGSGIIVSAQHHKNNGITASANYRLHLFNSPPSGVSTDGSAYVLNFANAPFRIGIIDFTHQTGVTTSTATFSITPFVNTPFICSSTSTALYGVLTPTAAVTSPAGEAHYIRLEILQN